MKRLLFLLAFLSFTGKSLAATLSGRVMSGNTCAPVSGQMVYLADSTNPFYNLDFDSVLTDANGDFIFTIPASVPASGAYLRVSTSDACGSFQHWAPYYYGENVPRMDFVVCGIRKGLGTVPLAAGGANPGDVWSI